MKLSQTTMSLKKPKGDSALTLACFTVILLNIFSFIFHGSW